MVEKSWAEEYLLLPGLDFYQINVACRELASLGSWSAPPPPASCELVTSLSVLGARLKPSKKALHLKKPMFSLKY